MLERGEVHLGQNLNNVIPPDDPRFGSQPLEFVDMLAACAPSFPLGKRRAIAVENEFASFPLLMMDAQFAVRRSFDAACRLAGVKPNILMESRTPHSFAGHGRGRTWAWPSFPLDFRRHLVWAAHRRRDVSGQAVAREPMLILWDKRRPQPRYVTAFCEMLAQHVKTVFPISRPSRAPGQH